MNSRTLPPSALEDWSEALQNHFGLQAADLNIELILDLAKEVAYGVARPAAPFSAYAAGLIVGRATAGQNGATAEAVIESINELARNWKDREPTP